MLKTTIGYLRLATKDTEENVQGLRSYASEGADGSISLACIRAVSEAVCVGLPVGAALLDALRIIRDDLDEAIDTGHVAIHATNGVDVTKIRNLANDATQ